jgi:hypothetical protein
MVILRETETGEWRDLQGVALRACGNKYFYKHSDVNQSGRIAAEMPIFSYLSFFLFISILFSFYFI